MPTIYEKLGELLSESLVRGEVLQFTEEDKFTEDKFSIFEKEESFSRLKPEKSKQETNNENENEKAAECLRQKIKENARKNSAQKNNTGIVYKKLSPELERAFRVLDVSVSANIDDVKKAYKEKLKYYHPDRHQNNEILQKVATTKTKQVVEAFNLISEYLTGK